MTSISFIDFWQVFSNQLDVLVAKRYIPTAKKQLFLRNIRIGGQRKRVPVQETRLEAIQASRNVAETSGKGRLEKPKAPRPEGARLRIVLSWQRPTLPPRGSTIGAEGLNYSVRNGKR
jgi:hypothetical protein